MSDRDEAVGRVRKYLDALPLAETTYVAVVSRGDQVLGITPSDLRLLCAADIPVGAGWVGTSVASANAWDRLSEATKDTPLYDLVQACYDHACQFIGRQIFAAKSATSWRPIADAPKDGTRILGTQHGVVRIYRWETEKWHKFPHPYWKPDGPIKPIDARVIQPTHFMPLPDPPEQS